MNRRVGAGDQGAKTTGSDAGDSWQKRKLLGGGGGELFSSGLVVK